MGRKSSVGTITVYVPSISELRCKVNIHKHIKTGRFLDLSFVILFIFFVLKQKHDK